MSWITITQVVSGKPIRGIVNTDNIERVIESEDGLIIKFVSGLDITVMECFEWWMDRNRDTEEDIRPKLGA